MRKIKIRSVFYWLSGMTLLSFGWTGCTKAISDSGSSGSGTQAVTYVVLMDLAPFSPATDIFLNDVQSTSAVTPGTFSSSYSNLTPASYDVKFKVDGSDSLLAELPSSPYDSMGFYTLILYNSDTVHKTCKAVKLTDNFGPVTATNAFFRFLDFCPELPPVDLYLNNQLLQQGRVNADVDSAATQYTLFQPVTPDYYNIEVKKAGTDTVLAYLNDVDLAAANGYTIFLSGSSKNFNFPISLNAFRAVY